MFLASPADDLLLVASASPLLRPSAERFGPSDPLYGMAEAMPFRSSAVRRFAPACLFAELKITPPTKTRRQGHPMPRASTWITMRGQG